MTPAEVEEIRIELQAEFWDDPEGFILTAFPFGEPGTALEESTGLEEWQQEVCRRVTSHIRSGETKPFRHSVASGHGIGKSAFVSMLIIWFMVCRPGCAGRVTANTDTQLKTTTWRELAKWWELCLYKDWFEKTATQFYARENPETWRIDAVSWSEENTIAFQGVHGKDVLYIFDEASGIPDSVWETAEGAMTEKNAFWLVFGNPNKNSGMFYRTFKPTSPWQTMSVDSRKVSWNHKDYGEDIREMYGEDAYKIRVLGQFPDTDMSQFIPGHAIQMAYQRGLLDWEDRRNPNIPIVLGVDVARFGVDATVILARRGNHILWIDEQHGLDIYQTAALVDSYIQKVKPALVNIDVVGYGAGVVDFLKNNGHRKIVFGVNNGAGSAFPSRFYNLRGQTWATARDWVTNHGVLREDDPKHRQMMDEVAEVLFGYNAKEQLKLERKEEIRKRIGKSPDLYDALALTFARRVPTYSQQQVHRTTVEYGR